MIRLHAALIVAVCALVTVFLRSAPFLFFGGQQGIPGIIRRLGRTLPPAIMAALVVYCLKSVPFGSAADGAKQLAAAAAVVVLHLCRKNTLLSIAGGTALYMLLLRL
ncbi:MAG: AzlD domain-containing protein [Clostridia bacterium]|nr:AzlD domain-containing protein [Clostridia bacterium]